MKAGLLMALESSEARLGQIARQMLAYGRPVPLDEIVAKVEAVTVESARAAGRALDCAAAGRRLPRLGPAVGLKAPRRLPKVWSGRRPKGNKDPSPGRHRHAWRFSAPSASTKPPRRSPATASCLRTPQPATMPNGRPCARPAGGFLTPWEPIWPADDLTRARLPPAAQALRRRPAQRSGLCLSDLPRARQWRWSAA